jgi:hypothetical protein
MATTTKLRKIFISYRREDAADAAGRIRDWLVQTKGIAREDVFVDVEAILPGADFAHVIEHAIDQCKAVIVIISPSWIAQVAENFRISSASRSTRMAPMPTSSAKRIVAAPAPASITGTTWPIS